MPYGPMGIRAIQVTNQSVSFPTILVTWMALIPIGTWLRDSTYKVHPLGLMDSTYRVPLLDSKLVRLRLRVVLPH